MTCKKGYKSVNGVCKRKMFSNTDSSGGIRPYINTIFMAMIVIGIGLIVYGVYSGFFSSNSTTIIEGNTIERDSYIIDKLDSPPDVTETCSLDITPTVVSVGGIVNGNIQDGPMTDCKIYYKKDATQWAFHQTVKTNMDGVYSGNQFMPGEGSYEFKAICDNCVTNSIIVRVSALDTDGDGIPDSTDPDDDNDGYTDEQEDIGGTNPLDANSHPEWNSCNSLCDDDGYDTGRGPVDSPGRCNSPEIYKDFNGVLCCCTPFVQEPTTNWNCCENKLTRERACKTEACSGLEALKNTYNNEADCLSGCRTTLISCSDTDGKDKFTRGTCIDSTQTVIDTCIGSQVTESYCLSDRCYTTNSACATGYTCDEGRCILATPPLGTSFDTDGGYVMGVFGTCVDDQGRKWVDYCGGDGIYITEYYPGTGPEAGFCIYTGQECMDSNGHVSTCVDGACTGW